MEYSLITGASGGIGECFARALAARRQNLALVARSGDKLKALAEELEAQGIHIETIALDLTEPDAPVRVYEALVERGVEISLLVNNAGFGGQGRFWDLDLERQTAMVRLNIEVLLELAHLFTPGMVERRKGGIINVSSTASFQPLPYTAVYAATKAFVTSFSASLTEELRPFGVKVVTLCPGPTRTGFFEAGQYKSMKMRVAFQSPEAVVAAALKKLDRGGGLVLSRRIDEVMLLSERLLPRSWLARMTAGIFKPD